MLERQQVKDGSNPCIFRISQEGLPFLLPFVTKQRVQLPLQEFLTLLKARAMRLPMDVPYATFRPPTVDMATGAPVDAADSAATDAAASAQAAAPGRNVAANGAAGAAADAAVQPSVGENSANSGKAAGEVQDAQDKDGVAAAPPTQDGGFSVTASGAPPPSIESERALEQLATVCAGCCVVTLECAL